MILYNLYSFNPLIEKGLRLAIFFFVRYDACMDVTDSDHKPVRCVFNVKIARVDESVRRQEFGNIINSNKKIKVMLGELRKVPETIVSTNNIILQNQDSTILRITNKSEKNIAFFKIICEGQSNIEEDGQAHDHQARGSFGFPQWLEVSLSFTLAAWLLIVLSYCSVS